MKIEKGILYLGDERVFPENIKVSPFWEEDVLCIVKDYKGRPVKDNRIWVGNAPEGEYDFKVIGNQLQLKKRKEVIIPEIISPVETAQKIMGLNKSVDDTTPDDILQKIFDLASNAEKGDAKEAIALRVAIDAFRWLYDEIKSQPPKKSISEVDCSNEFLEKWGIIENEPE